MSHETETQREQEFLEFARREREAKQRLAQFWRRLADGPAQLIVTHGLAVEMRAQLDALAPFVGDSVAVRRDCFGCLQPLTPERSVVGVVLIEFLDRDTSDMVLLAGLYAECTEGGEAVRNAAVQREFGEITSIRTGHPEAGNA